MFVTPEEERFAGFLDTWGIEWLYENHMIIFTLAEDGVANSGFSPDFYLPGYDLSVELTAGGPASMRKKLAKVRRSVDLYPYLRVRLLNRADVDLIDSDSSLEWLETVVLDGFPRDPLLPRPKLADHDEDVDFWYNKMLIAKESENWDLSSHCIRQLLLLGWDVLNRARGEKRLVQAILTENHREQIRQIDKQIISKLDKRAY